MFWDYWQLKCSPFDNVPDPRMYCDRNPSLEDAISEVLFAVEEGNDCLAVMVGGIGLGKTLALRVIMDELDPQRYRVVSVTNPDLTFIQMLREIVGQLKGQQVDARFRDALQEEFNRLLFAAAGEGRRVVIMIDEANALKRSVLQNLRLLTNMQDDDRNLVTIILAGQLELGKKLEARGMENLFQRIGVYCHIKGLETAELVRAYVEFRMGRAGALRPVFSPEAIERLLIHSRGVPRLVNKLCKLALKAGETNNLTGIDGELVDRIAAMFEKGKVWLPQEAPQPEAQVTAPEQAETLVPAAEPAEPAAEPPSLALFQPAAQATLVLESEAPEAAPDPGPWFEATEPPVAEAPEVVPEAALQPEAEVPVLAAAPEPLPEPSVEPLAEPAPASPEPSVRPLRPAPEPLPRPAPRPSVLTMLRDGQPHGPALSPEQVDQIVAELPDRIRAAIHEMDERQVVRLAGELAAKQMWQHEKAIRLSHGDPIDFWERSRAQIASHLRAISSQMAVAAG